MHCCMCATRYMCVYSFFKNTFFMCVYSFFKNTFFCMCATRTCSFKNTFFCVCATRTLNVFFMSAHLLPYIRRGQPGHTASVDFKPLLNGLKSRNADAVWFLDLHQLISMQYNFLLCISWFQTIQKWFEIKKCFGEIKLRPMPESNPPL